MRVPRKGAPGAAAPRSPDRLPAWACGSAAPRGQRPRRKHSPILPLGFVDVTVSASANFAALVFKQVLDPLPLAAQLHFKVIVHCHSLRGRGAGSGGRGTGVGTREAPAAAAPRSPPALHPAAAAPARPIRHEQEEAPRGPRGHPGAQRGRGRPGRGGTRRSPRAQESAGTRAGGGERVSLPLSPRTPGAPALLRAPAVRSAPAAGSGGAATAGSRPLTRALTLHPPAHTRSHALTHSLSHTLKQKGSPAQQPVPRQREEEGGDARNTAAAVAKTSRRLGLPLARPPARSAAAICPRRGQHPEDSVQGSEWPRPNAAAKLTTWTVPMVTRAPDYNAQNAPAAAVAAPSTTPPHTVGIWGALHDGISSPK